MISYPSSLLWLLVTAKLIQLALLLSSLNFNGFKIMHQIWAYLCTFSPVNFDVGSDNYVFFCIGRNLSNQNMKTIDHRCRSLSCLSRFIYNSYTYYYIEYNLLSNMVYILEAIFKSYSQAGSDPFCLWWAYIFQHWVLFWKSKIV